MATTEAQLDQIWGGIGVNPQAFPIYYTLGPATFKDDAGQPTSKAGSRLTLTRDLNNFPHLIFGFRYDVFFDLPDTPDAEDVAMYRLVKDYVDKEITVRTQLAQQNVIVNAAPIACVVGPKGETGNWHPFPQPYPMAGGNNIELEMVRQTDYPAFPSAPNDPIIPQISIVLVATMYRGIPQTMSSHRAIAQRER